MAGEKNDVNLEPVLGILQSEYSALKAEQTSRISIRDNSLISNFFAIGAVASISFASDPINKSVLLLIPLISSCICWVYLNNDIMVSRLRVYFTEEFPEKVFKALSSTVTVESKDQALMLIGTWERFHRITKYRGLRKTLNSFFVFLSFVIVSVGALMLTASDVFNSFNFETFIWIFDLLLIAIISIALLLTKDWK